MDKIDHRMDDGDETLGEIKAKLLAFDQKSPTSPPSSSPSTEGSPNKSNNSGYFKTDLVKQFVENFGDELVHLRQISPDTRFIDAVNQFYDKSGSLQPLAMKKVMESGKIIRPLSCSVPPSQVVYLLAEYGAERSMDSVKNELNLKPLPVGDTVAPKVKFASCCTCPNFTRSLYDIGVYNVKEYLGGACSVDDVTPPPTNEKSTSSTTTAANQKQATIAASSSIPQQSTAASTTPKPETAAPPAGATAAKKSIKRKRSVESIDDDDDSSTSGDSTTSENGGDGQSETRNTPTPTGKPETLGRPKPRDLYTVYRCKAPYCDYVADTLIGLEEHLRQPHRHRGGTYRWVCAMCRHPKPFKAKSRQNMIEHGLQKHHVIMDFEGLTFTYGEDLKCPWCNRQFNRAKAYTSHADMCYKRFLSDGAHSFDDEDIINRWLWPRFNMPGLRQVSTGEVSGTVSSYLNSLITVQRKNIAPSLISFTPAPNSGGARMLNMGGKPSGPLPQPTLVRKTVKDIVDLVSANKTVSPARNIQPGRLALLSAGAGNFRPLVSTSTGLPMMRVACASTSTLPKGGGGTSTSFLFRNAGGQLVNVVSTGTTLSQLATAKATAIAWSKAGGISATGDAGGQSSSLSKNLTGLVPQLDKTAAQIFVCELCDIAFYAKLLYVKHLKYGHNKLMQVSDAEMAQMVPLLSCSRCRDRFYTCEGLERHLLMSHSLVTAELLYKAHRKQDSGKCKQCGKIYAFNLLHHLVLDHKCRLCSAKVVYNCDLCSGQFQSYEALESHLVAKHPAAATNSVGANRQPSLFGGPPPPKLRQMMPILSPSAPQPRTGVASQGSIIRAPTTFGRANQPPLRGVQPTAYRSIRPRPAATTTTASSSSGAVQQQTTKQVAGGRSKKTLNRRSGKKFRSMSVIMADRKRKASSTTNKTDQSANSTSKGGASSEKTAPPPPKKPAHYWCTPCRIKFTVYAQVLAHWAERHLKRVRVQSCRIDQCEPCRKKLTLDRDDETTAEKMDDVDAPASDNVDASAVDNVDSANNSNNKNVKKNIKSTGLKLNFDFLAEKSEENGGGELSNRDEEDELQLVDFVKPNADVICLD